MPNSVSGDSPPLRAPLNGVGMATGGSLRSTLNHNTNSLGYSLRAGGQQQQQTAQLEHALAAPAIRPSLELSGIRDSQTNMVRLTCHCMGFPAFSHPIVALFVCRDARSERDRFTYLGQTQPSQSNMAEADLTCVFQIADCAPPEQKEAEDVAEAEERDLSPRSLADRFSRPQAPKRPTGPITLLKFNVYQTINSESHEYDGGLRPEDLLGTAYLDIERLLEKGEGQNDTTPSRRVNVEIGRVGSLPDFSNGGRRESQALSGFSALSSSLPSSSATPQYTTLNLSHSIPPAFTPASSSAASTILHTDPSGATSSSSAAAPIAYAVPPTSTSGPFVYGVSEDALRNVWHTPQLTDEVIDERHEDFIRRQKEEAARAERRGLKPINPTEIPRGGRYELGDSKSASLLTHQQKNSRMCSTDEGCIIS